MTNEDLIRDWVLGYTDYKDTSWVVLEGYSSEEFGKSSVAGRCYYKSDGTSRIILNAKLEGHPMWTRIVLWHEFCHAWAHRDGENAADWNGPFMKRLLKKPLYFLGHFALAFAWVAL